jgi:hypothetical protein
MPSPDPVDVLVVTGPCGVGKSSVGFECMNLLEAANVPAARVDGELAYYHPKRDPRGFGYPVATEALRAIWPVYAAQGIRRLLLARVVEDVEQRAIVERAIPSARLRILRLVAGEATIRARLAQREIGSGLDWHVRRSAEIARSTLGEPIDAERSVPEVSRDVLDRAGWLPHTR